MNFDILLKIIIIMAPLSLAALGGATSIYAPMQHHTVDVEQWVTAREFLDLFAIARVTPGPGSMLGTLIGWKVAGLAGAIVASLALYLPSSALVFGVGQVWHKHRGKRWHTALENGLAPIGCGLLFAGVLTLGRIAAEGVVQIAIIPAVAALMMFWPKLHPFFFLLGAGLICYSVYLAGF
ncbi:MAG: Chromate transport protein ChrA [Hyphomicrobiales bacterium]|jgi:chromate transporter|nr:Chromate transport protein ChrA [Hyphomicrobiales bacterium]